MAQKRIPKSFRSEPPAPPEDDPIEHLDDDPEYDPQQDVTPQAAIDYQKRKPMTKETTETTAQKIARLKAEVDALENQQRDEMTAKLLSLPEMMGYGSGPAGFVALITALSTYTDGKIKVGGKAKAKASTGKKRATITPEMRTAIIKDFPSMTASAIAEKHGVSVASVNTIKKAAGLTAKK